PIPNRSPFRGGGQGAGSSRVRASGIRHRGPEVLLLAGGRVDSDATSPRVLERALVVRRNGTGSSVVDVSVGACAEGTPTVGRAAIWPPCSPPRTWSPTSGSRGSTSRPRFGRRWCDAPGVAAGHSLRRSR